MSTTIPAGSIAVRQFLDTHPRTTSLYFLDASTGALLGNMALSGLDDTTIECVMDVVADGTFAMYPGLLLTPAQLPDTSNPLSFLGGWIFPAGTSHATELPFFGGMCYGIGASDGISLFTGLFKNYDIGLDQWQSHVQVTDKTGANVNYWRLNGSIGAQGDYICTGAAPNPGGTILYHFGEDRYGNGCIAIHRLNLATGGAMSDLATEASSINPFTLTVLPNGNIVALWSFSPSPPAVKVYDPSGSTVYSWDPSATSWSATQTRGLDSLSIWTSGANAFPPPDATVYVNQFDISDGTLTNTFPLTGVIPDGLDHFPLFFLTPVDLVLAEATIVSVSYNCQSGAVTIVGVAPNFGTPGTISILDPDDAEVSGAVSHWSPDRITASMTYTTAGVYTVTVTPAGASASAPYSATINCDTPVVTYQVRRERVFPLPWDNANCQKFISRLEFIIQAGIGNAAAPNPQMMMSLSRDGGETFGPETQLSAGAVGEYSRRVFLNRLGRARNPVVKLIVSDPVNWQLIQCLVDMEKGLS